MITEDYVSFEVANLLKEKGFEISTGKVYDNQNKLDYQNVVCWQEKRLPYISAPTHQMAMKWLREIKNIVIIPEIHTTTEPKDYYWGASIYYLDKPRDLVKWISEPSKGKCEGYNEVIEAALKYTLENLL